MNSGNVKTGPSISNEIADELTEAPAEDIANKPEFVKTIESFDINSFTPENFKFMVDTIHDYFLENFPVKKDVMDKYPDHVTLLGAEDFVNTGQSEDGNRGYVDFDISNTTGFFDQKSGNIYINKSVHKSPGALFCTMFHEALHYSSISAGAGFAGNFLHPIYNDDEKYMPEDILVGLRTLDEGSVQFITLGHILEKMGFEPQDSMFSYEGERHVMQSVWNPYGANFLEHLYFETPLDDIRMGIEKEFEPSATRDKITRENGNGIFCECLKNLGIAAQRMNMALKKFEETGDRTEPDNILMTVRHAVGYHLVNHSINNNYKFTEQEKIDLRDYLEPFRNSKGELLV